MSRARVWALTGVVIFALYLSGPARYESDSYYAYATATSIVHRGSLDVSGYGFPEEDQRLVEVDGQRLNYFSWPLALVVVPPVLVLDGAHAVGLGPGSEGLSRYGIVLVEMIVGSMVTAAAAVLVGWAASRVSQPIGEDSRRHSAVGVAVALMFAFTTGAWSTASRDLNQHGPSLLLLAGAAAVAVTLAQDDAGSRRARAALLGALLAAAYTVRPTNLLLLVAVLVWLTARHRFSLPGFVAGAGAVGAGWLVVNRLSYGSWLPPYFAANRLRWHDSFGEALAGNLISPARGLLVYSPLVVLLAIAGTALAVAGGRCSSSSLRWLAGCTAAACVAHWIAVSAFPHWWGGYSYGPRFMVDLLVPLSLLAVPAVDALVDLAAVRGRRSVALGVLAIPLLWGFVVNAEAAYLPRSVCWNSTPDIDTNPWRVWSWSDPQFAAGFRSLPDLTPKAYVRSYVEPTPC